MRGLCGVLLTFCIARGSRKLTCVGDDTVTELGRAGACDLYGEVHEWTCRGLLGDGADVKDELNEADMPNICHITKKARCASG
jgi:hypothetical protein